MGPGQSLTRAGCGGHRESPASCEALALSAACACNGVLPMADACCSPWVCISNGGSDRSSGCKAAGSCPCKDLG